MGRGLFATGSGSSWAERGLWGLVCSVCVCARVPVSALLLGTGKRTREKQMGP